MRLGGPCVCMWERERLWDTEHLLFQAIPLFFLSLLPSFPSTSFSFYLLPNPPYSLIHGAKQLLLTFYEFRTQKQFYQIFFTIITFFWLSFLIALRVCVSSCAGIANQNAYKILCFQCPKPWKYHLIYILLCLFQLYDIAQLLFFSTLLKFYFFISNFVVNKNLR